MKQSWFQVKTVTLIAVLNMITMDMVRQ